VGVEIDRKAMSELAIHNHLEAFAEITEATKSMLSA